MLIYLVTYKSERVGKGFGHTHTPLALEAQHSDKTNINLTDWSRSRPAYSWEGSTEASDSLPTAPRSCLVLDEQRSECSTTAAAALISSSAIYILLLNIANAIHRERNKRTAMYEQLSYSVYSKHCILCLHTVRYL